MASSSSMVFSTNSNLIKLERRFISAQVRVGMVTIHGFPAVNGISTKVISSSDERRSPINRLSFSHTKDVKLLQRHLAATGSGVETSVTDKKKDALSLEDVNVVVESRDEDKIHVRVDLTGEQTQKAFDAILMNLARTAPPMPGFRRTKGGKTSNVPKSFLLQMLGQDRVTKFLIQEILSTTIGDYVEKEQLKVKTQLNTTQTAEELESAFIPGSEFSFNATLEIEKANTEEAESKTSDVDS